MRAHRAPAMTVGELSHRTGVPVKNLREYTDLGLIYSLGRSRANYRLYDEDALWCVRWIDELRGLGLTVAEIRELAAAAPGGSGGSGPPAGTPLAGLLQRSRERLEERIAVHRRTLLRIEEFERAHRHELDGGVFRPDGDPRCAAGA